MTKIINYQPSYYDKLLLFYKKNWRERRVEDYLDYTFFKVSTNPLDIEKNLLAINDEDDVVGCNLFFPAKAMIFGGEHLIFWSHDTFIEENYRGVLGMDLILQTASNKWGFGVGLSPISRKIQKKIKTNFIAETTDYFIFNRWTIKLLFHELGLIRPQINHFMITPDKIKIGKDIFELIKHAEDVDIPNEGYWNKGKLDIEMNRDTDYLKHRFFNNFITYYFYQKKHGEKKSYFVFRKIVKRGMPAISLVDFRYDLDDFCEYKKILRAINKIAIRNWIPIVAIQTTTISDKKIRFCPLIIRKEKTAEVTTNIKNIVSPSIFMTSADSDSDIGWHHNV